MDLKKLDGMVISEDSQKLKELIDTIVYRVDDTDKLIQIFSDLSDNVKRFVFQVLRRRYWNHSNKFNLFLQYSRYQYPTRVSLLITLRLNESGKLMDKYGSILLELLMLEKIEPNSFYCRENIKKEK